MLTVFGAWLVGSRRAGRRRVGFWVYLVSNAAWATWGFATGAHAVLLLQAVLAGLNVRGMRKARMASRS